MLSKITAIIVYISAAVFVNITMQQKALKKITAELLQSREQQKMLEELRAKDCDRTQQKK